MLFLSFVQIIRCPSGDFETTMKASAVGSEAPNGTYSDDYTASANTNNDTTKTNAKVTGSATAIAIPTQKKRKPAGLTFE